MSSSSAHREGENVDDNYQTEVDQNSESFTSFDSSTKSQETKLTANLSPRKAKKLKLTTARKGYSRNRKLKGNTLSDRYKVKEVGNTVSDEPFCCSIYITSYNPLEDSINMQLTVEPFSEILNSIASGKIKIQKTHCGIIVAFTKEDDADKLIRLPLQKIFGGPVQVARFLTGEYKFRHNIIIKDIPWCISNAEIYEALKFQGIETGRVIRTRTHVQIEVLNALDMQRLLEEGLNFFNYTSFMAVLESNVNQIEPNIVQCFKCQGFWHTSTHCRHVARCVRCGENHDVEYCPRPRNAPVCCHCGGPHHAAYKLCPVRLQHINSTHVRFQLAKNKPNKSFQNNII